jgi:glycine/D-amino acid oxidase-like deaminating enzyme
MKYDRIIIGAGLYGLYAADFCAGRGDSCLVLEYDSEAFKRATYINQARVHMGYHYPRSLSTAVKSAGYFNRFNEDFGFCVLTSFDQIYATSANFSWTSAAQFQKFCHDAGIRCDEVPVNRYFKQGVCDGAFLTEEYTYDAHILRNWYLERLDSKKAVTIQYNARVKKIVRQQDVYQIYMEDGTVYESRFVLNATYASCNQLLGKCEAFQDEAFGIKYELCEIILCDVDEKLMNTGLTVMDGPFFSIMPFGKTGRHSLTAVTFTPHMTSYDKTPKFECQKRSEGYCTAEQLGNCNDCPAKPQSAWDYMSGLARKYMRDELKFEYQESLFSMKPILKVSEVDDSRPTVIKIHSSEPYFVSVLSGKINTVYDLDEILIL